MLAVAQHGGAATEQRPHHRGHRERSGDVVSVVCVRRVVILFLVAREEMEILRYAQDDMSF
jgi:hypothetical protein